MQCGSSVIYSGIKCEIEGQIWLDGDGNQPSELVIDSRVVFDCSLSTIYLLCDNNQALSLFAFIFFFLFILLENK